MNFFAVTMLFRKTEARSSRFLLFQPFLPESGSIAIVQKEGPIDPQNFEFFSKFCWLKTKGAGEQERLVGEAFKFESPDNRLFTRKVKE